jgi:hypothetical protein
MIQNNPGFVQVKSNRLNVRGCRNGVIHVADQKMIQPGRLLTGHVFKPMKSITVWDMLGFDVSKICFERACI